MLAFIRMKKEGLAVTRSFGPWMRSKNMNNPFPNEITTSTALSNDSTKTQSCSSWWQWRTVRTTSLTMKGKGGNSLSNKQLTLMPLDEGCEVFSNFAYHGRETISKVGGAHGLGHAEEKAHVGPFDRLWVTLSNRDLSVDVS
ncbi:hypothetical protein PTKIN_Ptkin03bG0212300 [Pterospermum kingtungense]